MSKKLTLLIIFLPILLWGQETPDANTSKPKKKDTRQFIPPDQPYDKYAFDNKLPKPLPDEEPVDLSKESLFKGLFSAGLNISQIDGDAEYGYQKVGAYVGVGTLVKFHKNFSVSLEMIYSMRGAKPRFKTFLDSKGDEQRNRFNITADYIDIPLSLNIHDKKFVIFGLGLNLGTLLRYKEITRYGNDTTNAPAPFVRPARFDLGLQASFMFLIKEQFGLGVKFQYSVLSSRPSYESVSSKIKGQYNNLITVRFSYLLDTKKMKYRQQKKR